MTRVGGAPVSRKDPISPAASSSKTGSNAAVVDAPVADAVEGLTLNDAKNCADYGESNSISTSSVGSDSIDWDEELSEEEEERRMEALRDLVKQFSEPVTARLEELAAYEIARQKDREERRAEREEMIQILQNLLDQAAERRKEMDELEALMDRLFPETAEPREQNDLQPEK